MNFNSIFIFVKRLLGSILFPLSLLIGIFFFQSILSNLSKKKDCPQIIALHPPEKINQPLRFPGGGYWLDHNDEWHQFDGLVIEVNKIKYDINCSIEMNSEKYIYLSHPIISKDLRYFYDHVSLRRIKDFYGPLYMYNFDKEYNE